MQRLASRQLVLLWVLLSLCPTVLIACGRAEQAAVLPTIMASAQPIAALDPALTPAPSRQVPLESPDSTPTVTASPVPAIDAPPTATPTPADTATPTFTPTPVHPLMIAVMRQQSYPGSDLVFEQRLEPGSNYDRHIVSYQSEGNKIFALLTVPHGQRPATGWPVVIFNHGYIPPDEYRTTERYVAYVDALASSGYIVFRSDYRGHGSSEGVAVGGYSSPAYTADVLNGMAAVQKLAEADAAKVGMWGHSMGGQITLRAMVVSNEIRAGVIWAGVVASYPDLFERWRQRLGDRPTRTPDPTRLAAGGGQSLFELFFSGEENLEFWSTISPNAFLGDLSGPVQLHHGTADSSVPVTFSQKLEQEIRAAGRPVELFLYEGDNHNISASFDTAMDRSIAFFDAHVKQGD